MNISKSLSLILLSTILLVPSSLSMPLKFNHSPRQNFVSEDSNNINVYEKINPAIVSIEAEVPEGISSGAGCIINSNGKILTSRHVVDGATYIEVRTSTGETYKGTVLPIKHDLEALAILKNLFILSSYLTIS